MSKKLNELLSKFTKEELISIIEDLSSEYKEIEDKLIMKYNVLDVDDEIKKNKKYLTKITRKYGMGRRFVNWRECGSYASEVIEVLDNAKEYYNDLYKPAVVVETSLEVISRMINALDYMDDSNGDIGDVINYAFDLIDETCMDVEEFSQEDKKRLFKKLLNEGDKEVYDGWSDWRLQAINNCIYFCKDEKNRKKFEEKIDELIEKNNSDDYSKNYFIEHALNMKLNLYNYVEDNEKAQKLIEENLKYPSFRENMIIKYRDLKDYKKVIELAEDGEISDEKYIGLVHKWKTYRYLANKELNNVEEVEKLGRYLFLNGNMSILEDLKEIHKSDWNEYYLGLKAELSNDSRYTNYLYINMLIKENDLEALLEVCKKDIRYIEDFAEILMEDYKEDVEYIYRVYIERISDIASDRKKYKSVCKVIKNYKKLFGDIGTVKIVRELKAKYIKRPAFIDELSKI